MMRLFETNRIRMTRSLAGTWDFFTVSDDGQENSDRLYRLAVPGPWEMHPELINYRGRGVYRKKVRVTQKTNLRLVFKGVSHTADVYFDGAHVAHHYSAYTAFDAVISDVEPGEHELEVRVDNGFHEGSSLHVPNDYYTYGGIIRPIGLEELGDVFIERIAFTPVMADGKWQADIRTWVRNLSDQEQHVEIHGQAAGETFSFGGQRIAAGERVEVSGTFAFPQARPWSHEEPNLYELELQLALPDGSVVDDLIERVGFRVVTTLIGKIQVNGKDIVLKGFNRHEDHGIVGPSFPLSLMVQDLDLMADMGCNSVRTSHYPNDELFLDLCDERGFYVWEENHARGLNLEQMRNPNFVQQCEDVNREMVEQHMNHPSIIIWAILNECASHTEEGRVHYKRQLEQLRSLDNSRTLSFASHHRSRELCFDLADIVSFNLYPGWYGTEEPGELCDQARGWADAAGGAGKPMIMSEFGGDAIYGYRTPSRVKGSEERQADIIDANLQAYLERDFVSGMFIWQFADCRVTEETHWPLTRVSTQNIKGVVDIYRRPKLAYDAVKKHYTRV